MNKKKKKAAPAFVCWLPSSRCYRTSAGGAVLERITWNKAQHKKKKEKKKREEEEEEKKEKKERTKEWVFFSLLT